MPRVYFFGGDNMERKYQVWVNLDFVGQITGDDVTIEDAIAYAIDWRGEIDRADVEMCEISESYYRDLEQSTAKDSLELGM